MLCLYIKVLTTSNIHTYNLVSRVLTTLQAGLEPSSHLVPCIPLQFATSEHLVHRNVGAATAHFPCVSYLPFGILWEFAMMFEALRTVLTHGRHSINIIILSLCFDNFLSRYLILQSLADPRVPVCGLKMLCQLEMLYPVVSVVLKFSNSKMTLPVEHSPPSPLSSYCKMKLLH